MQTLLQDLRFGTRMLLKQPGFTVIAIITLALGIGANTAIFSVVNAVLLRPLPFAEPERIVRMYGKFSGGSQAATSPPDFLDYRAQNQAFEDFAALRNSSYNLSGEGEPERVLGAEVTANFFHALGITLLQGRAFTPEEEGGQTRIALISEGLWQRRFAADPAIVGKTFPLDGQTHTIVGVVPKEARMLNEIEVWRPLTFDSQQMKARRFHFLRAFGRLKPGISLAQAQADLDTIAVGLEQQYPASNTSWRLRMVPLRQELLGTVTSALYVLLGAVGLVLLIACANVANLLLAKATARQKEIAIRSALGAGRGRLLKQMLTESFLLSVAGGAAGLLVAVWGAELLVKLTPSSIPRADNIGVDAAVLSFTLLLSLLTGTIFGLLPAWQASKPDFNEALKDGGKGAAGTRGAKTRNILVVAEIALALVLLIGAGLLLQSFYRLQNVELGFNPNNVLTMRIVLPEAKYGESGKPGLFFDQVLQRVNAMPGVQAAGTTTQLPLRGGGDTYFKIEGRPFPGSNQQVTAFDPAVSHDYFRAIGIPFVKGRPFTEAETKEQPKVVIINESFAQTFFREENPLGQRLLIDEGNTLTCEIVGVVANSKQFSLASGSPPTIYLPRLEVGQASLVIRTSGDPMALASAVTSAVRAVDNDQPVSNVQSMERIIASSVAEPRFRTLLLGLFAVLAVGLAGIGIYGVLSYSINQRRHEIGIRMALGAKAGDVMAMVLRQGMFLAVAGLGGGLLIAFALTRLMRDFLFGVSATDPLTFVVVSLVLAFVAFAACYFPARRATKVDPMIALRCE